MNAQEHISIVEEDNGQPLIIFLDTYNSTTGGFECLTIERHVTRTNGHYIDNCCNPCPSLEVIQKALNLLVTSGYDLSDLILK